MNAGIDEATADYLRAISLFKLRSTQAKYFMKFAEGSITVKDLLKVLKRTDREGYELFSAAKYYWLVRRASAKDVQACVYNIWMVFPIQQCVV